MTKQNEQDAEQTTIGTIAASVPFNFEAHGAELGHSVVIGPTKGGMSVYDAFRLSTAEAAAIRSTDATS
ncbi:hypothetical protein [Burkholderia vietnamiensis]|uniref:hypothetical protein n=1 Tax=Burkholderia vietnamiensis TaxID=60552 RepID=UPI000758D5A2|nr:hypothetical protein [Burkholderia vietnamiensis]KVR92526.1 hypothetical protein WK27_00050 [Burkholderia vietnamiensis]MCA8073943.1 hypothetical protein [Burkholderia vietnamiensis]